MKNDLDKTFGQIFDNDITAFRNQLIEVQHHQANRKDAEKWVQQLRFLDISKVPDLRTKPGQRVQNHLGPQYTGTACPIPITRQTDDNGKTPYVAISWKWATHPGSNYSRQRPKYNYMIRRPDARPHKSEFHDIHLERVIMFAQSRYITNLWIDTECIYQKKEDSQAWPNDKDHGVQIMDVVYGLSTESVGLLNTPLSEQREIDTLASLLTRSFLMDPDDMEEPEIKWKTDIRELQMLILKILSDTRWSRGWIFQEDHLASDNMTLLIPCSDYIQRGDKYDFGLLPDDIQVSLKDLRQAVTMFCLTNKEDEKSWPNSEMMSKVKQYNIWNRVAYDGPYGGLPQYQVKLWREAGQPKSHDYRVAFNTEDKYEDVAYYPTTTNSVLDDICSRSLEKEEDRVAILANALKFSKRLDICQTSPILSGNNFSLSVALLALILINGEILMNSDYDHFNLPEYIMDHTLRSYLRRYEYKFDAPSLRFEQSFIDRCRFKSPLLTDQGIQTKGFLFALLPRDNSDPQSNPIRFTNSDRVKLEQISQNAASHRRPFGKKLNAMAVEAMQIVIGRLKRMWPNSKLAAYLEEHLHHDLYSRKVQAVSTPYVLDMMSAVCQALLDNRDLRFGRLVSDSDAAEPTAIFIAPPSGWGSETHHLDEVPHVFTSWDGPQSKYDRERLASLEVDVYQREGSTSHNRNEAGRALLSYGWVNGVWMTRGEQMESFVFPLPGITDMPKETERIERKRKRSVDDEGGEGSEEERLFPPSRRIKEEY
jgi:hypothetical protein